jgi:mRNA interferase MazF
VSTGSLPVAPRRGEVWWIALDPTVGSEIQKTRPCLVIGTDALARLPVRIIVPITTWQPKHASRPWCIPIQADRSNGLKARSAADAVQVRSLSVQRFRQRMGSIDPSVLAQVLAGVALCLDPLPSAR